MLFGMMMLSGILMLFGTCGTSHDRAAIGPQTNPGSSNFARMRTHPNKAPTSPSIRLANSNLSRTSLTRAGGFDHGR